MKIYSTVFPFLLFFSVYIIQEIIFQILLYNYKQIGYREKYLLGEDKKRFPLSPAKSLYSI